MAERKHSPVRPTRKGGAANGKSQKTRIAEAPSAPRTIECPKERAEALGCLHDGHVRLALWAAQHPDDEVVGDLVFIINELLIAVDAHPRSDGLAWRTKLSRFRAVADDVADIDNRYISDLGEFVRIVEMVRGVALPSEQRSRMFIDVARFFGATKTPVLGGLSTSEADLLVRPLLESPRCASAVVASLVYAAIARGQCIGTWSSKTTPRQLEKAIDNHRKKRRERRTSTLSVSR